jgi:hypothetical protein
VSTLSAVRCLLRLLHRDGIATLERVTGEGFTGQARFYVAWLDASLLGPEVKQEIDVTVLVDI